MRNFIFIGLAPLIGAVILTYVFVKALFNFSDLENAYSSSEWLGFAPPAVIGVGMILLGCRPALRLAALQARAVLQAAPRGGRPEGARGRSAVAGGAE